MAVFVTTGDLCRELTARRIPSSTEFSSLVLGLMCAIARSDRSAYRFAGVTLAVVLLIPRANPTWQIGLHRHCVALILEVVWPERESTPPGNM